MNIFYKKNKQKSNYKQRLLYSSIFFMLLCILSCDSPVPKKKQLAKAPLTVAKITPDPMPKPVQPIKKDSVKQTFSLAYIMGKFDPITHPDFQELATKHASDKKMYLRKDVYAAFIQLYDAAQKDGLKFTIRSATRPFQHQKRIWEGKWGGKRLVKGKNLSKTTPDPKNRALKILQYSSMPGTSRHHWGTDFDLNAFVNSYFEKGKGKKEYDWLVANAAKYGFGQPYTSKEAGRTGYEEEKWHWSYLPVSKKLTEEAEKYLENGMINDFKGSETAISIEVVENYVLGIDKACR